MCKNLMIAGIKPDKDTQKKLQAFLQTMAPIMGTHDDDGLGYAAMTDKGIYMERWVDPNDAFSFRKMWSKKDSEIKDKFEGLLHGNAVYKFQAEQNNSYKEPVFSVIMHARFATVGDPVLKNVHPFYRDGVALIHNGGIVNHEEKHLEKVYSTCDSETILNSYVKHEVSKDFNFIQKVAEELRGSYTCGVLTKTDDGKEVLDVFRNSNSLFATHVKELDAVVFCTSSQMIREACAKLKWDHGNFFSMEDENIARIDARTGRFLGRTKFRPGVGAYWNKESFYGRDGQYKHGPHANTSTESSTTNDSNTDNAAASTSIATPKELGTISTQESTEVARAGVDEKKSLMKPRLLELEKMRRLGNTCSLSTELVANIAELSKLRH